MEHIRGAWLVSAMGIFFGWAFLAWLVRVWAKLRTKAWTLDDYAISGSVEYEADMESTQLSAFLHLVFVSYAIRHGYGKPLDTLSASGRTRVQVSLYLGQLFYVVSFGLFRVAAALFITYISHSGPHIKPAQVVAFIAAAWTLTSLLAISIRGDITQPWVVLDGSSSMFIRWLGIETTGIVIELALWGIAVHLVWGIQRNFSKRILIICAFGARLLVVPCLIARLVLLHPRINAGPARGATMADLVTEASVHLSILAGSATALKPFLTSFYVTHPATLELTTSTSGLRSKDRSGGSDPYCRLESAKPAIMSSRGGSVPVVINRGTVCDIMWQTASQGSSSHQASAYSKSDFTSSASRSVTNSTIDYDGRRRRGTPTGTTKAGRTGAMEPHVSLGSEDPGRIIIQKTTEVTVQYK